MNWETYVAFGDSITIGARSYLSYPEHVGAILETATKKKWNVINHATSGFTTIDLLRSIDENYANLSNSKASIATLFIGVNDIKKNTELEEFAIAYNLILTKLKIILAETMIKVFEIPLFPPGVMYPYTLKMNDKISEFNEMIRKVAVNHGLKTYPFKVSEEYLYDGVHLNALGCKKTADYLSELILHDRGL